MKINEVEKRVEISKKSIRFYEQEGLLHPERNKENGYRDYSEEDVNILLKIKFLRKLRGRFKKAFDHFGAGGKEPAENQ